MNRIFKITYITIISLLVACSSDNNVGADSSVDAVGSYGKVVFDLSRSGEFLQSDGEVSSKELVSLKSEEVDFSDYSLYIYSSDGELYASYSSYSSVPSILQMPQGSYSILVESSALQGVAFDSPYYKGAIEELIVTNGETSNAEVDCQLSNSLITFNLSDDFLLSYSNYVINITNENGSVTLTPEETRSVYIDPSMPYTVKIMAWDYNSEAGDAPQVYEYTVSETESQTHYQVTVSVSYMGTVSQSITIDYTTIDVEIEELLPSDDEMSDNDAPDWYPEDSDDSDDSGDTEVVLPTIEGATFDIDQAITITDDEAGTVAVVANITAKNGGIANLYVTIDSPDIGDMLIENLFDGSSTFDLANLESGSSTENTLLSVGFIDATTVIKGLEVYNVDISGFMSLLTAGGYGSQTHKFHLRVVDSKGGEASQTVTIVRTN